ncbi:response regulator transcription factor [Streptomyces olivaceus]
MRSIRVAIHAEDPLVSIGLKSSIRESSHMVVVGTEDGAPADVVVVLLDTVDVGTMDLLRTFEKPGNGFLLVVGNGWKADYSEIAELGVRAVLWRSDFSRARLVSAVFLVNSGDACLPASLQGGLLDHVKHVRNDVLAPRGLTSSGLSAREVDVLRLAADGYAITEISQKLAYSERTIKNVFYGLMKQFNLKNRTHVVSYAIRAGVI